MEAQRGNIGAYFITNIVAPYSLYNYGMVYGTSNGPENDIGKLFGPL